MRGQCEIYRTRIYTITHRLAIFSHFIAVVLKIYLPSSWNCSPVKISSPIQPASYIRVHFLEDLPVVYFIRQ